MRQEPGIPEGNKTHVLIERVRVCSSVPPGNMPETMSPFVSVYFPEFAAFSSKRGFKNKRHVSEAFSGKQFKMFPNGRAQAASRARNPKPRDKERMNAMTTISSREPVGRTKVFSTKNSSAKLFRTRSFWRWPLISCAMRSATLVSPSSAARTMGRVAAVST
jgi:hypothetical protein